LKGAAQGIEDAAVLGECLSRATSIDEVPSFVKAYETIRKPRAERVKAISLGNSKVYAYPDGPEQEARDKLYGQSLNAPKNAEKRQAIPMADSTAAYATPEFSMWLFGYDVANDIRRYFNIGAL
jgi:salicylate hydroxylase